MWNESKCQRSNTLHIGVNVCTVKRCNRLQERTFGLEENSLFSLEVARPINEIFKTTPTLANCLNFLKHLRRQHEINFGVNELTARWLTRRVCIGAPNRYLRIIFTTRRENKKTTELEKVCDQLWNHWLLNRSEFLSALRDQVLVSSQLHVWANVAYQVLSFPCLYSLYLIKSH